MLAISTVGGLKLNRLNKKLIKHIDEEKAHNINKYKAANTITKDTDSDQCYANMHCKKCKCTIPLVQGHYGETINRHDLVAEHFYTGYKKLYSAPQSDEPPLWSMMPILMNSSVNVRTSFVNSHPAMQHMQQPPSHSLSSRYIYAKITSQPRKELMASQHAFFFHSFTRLPTLSIEPSTHSSALLSN